MDLAVTRKILDAIHAGELDEVETQEMPIFGLHIPTEVPGVDPHILVPKNTWSFPDQYDTTMQTLAANFVDNFKEYEAGASEAIRNAGPKLE
jgi:phosphoenolpyruvate carboxykinase (ATP)